MTAPAVFPKIDHGHERQRQAPARWPATLLRGGVLRVTTRPRRSPGASTGRVRPTVEENHVDEELTAPSGTLRPRYELVLLAVHVLAVADVDCPGSTAL